MDDSRSAPEGQRRAYGMDEPAFLLAQIGGLAAARFAQRLEALELSPAHAGVLRLIATAEGMSQRALADRLAILPARLVGIIDNLEQRGLVERRRNPEDRRNHALYLTPEGFAMLSRLGRIAREHQEALLKGLDAVERADLGRLLRRLALELGLVRGVHPGFRNL